LFFKPGTLSFGWGAGFELDWNRMPTIALDMEFRHRSVWLVFKLILSAAQTDVTVEHLSVDKTPGGLTEDMIVLMEAIADARLGTNKH
jgi:hypothetical protein